MWPSGLSRCLKYLKTVAADAETYVASGKRHTIDPLRVVMIRRTGILRENVLQYGELLTTEVPRGIVRNDNGKPSPFPYIHKTTPYIRMAVGIAHIGLDVVDRRPVHQVSSTDINASALHPLYADRGKPQTIRTEGRTGGEDTDTLITAQTGRTHGKPGSRGN
jgi:hypothetical protein